VIVSLYVVRPVKYAIRTSNVGPEFLTKAFMSGKKETESHVKMKEKMRHTNSMRSQAEKK
jgi:hypothetical protein